MENNTIKFQVVNTITHKALFTGTGDECQNWIADYGLGNSQFTVLPFDGEREYMDIIDTY